MWKVTWTNCVCKESPLSERICVAFETSRLQLRLDWDTLHTFSKLLTAINFKTLNCSYGHLCESRFEWLPETESGDETEPRPDFCFACVRMCDFRFVDCANFLLQPCGTIMFIYLIITLLPVQYLEGADVGAISSMNAHVCPQVEVERESLSTALESALERFLPRVNKLVAFQFTALHKSLSTFGANMYPA